MNYSSEVSVVATSPVQASVVSSVSGSSTVSHVSFSG
jgi:hypothetical protein